MNVRVRIAPSPTGDPHVGTAYIALFNMVFARQFQGKFILRIEDTDRSRSRIEYENSIFEALRWCGLVWDEGPDIGGAYGPYRQSERFDIYKRYAYQLVEEGKAYKDFATPEELAALKQLGKKGYDRRYRTLSAAQVEEKEKEGLPYTIRLKVPLTGEIEFEDQIKGKITVPCADIDDQVLLKSDGFPTYHLANVVDDHLMEISHVIRGDEWVSSTPKHILLYQSFGWKPPIFLHMPLLLGMDGKKLSKRRNPTSIFFYRDCGYLPEALSNFLTLMGYSMAQPQEIYSIEYFISQFDPKRIGSSAAVFDIKKLDWLNQQYLIKQIPVSNLWNRIQQWCFSDAFIEKLMPLCHTRIKTFGEWMELCYFFFVNHIQLSQDLFPSMPADQLTYLLQGMIWAMEEEDKWDRAHAEAASHKVAQVYGVHHKKIIIPLLFVALTGKRQGPPLYDSIELLGKERVRARLLEAIHFLGGISPKKAVSLKEQWLQGNCTSFIIEKTQ